MACIAFPTPLAMATTQLAQAIGYEVPAPRRKRSADQQPLRMNWVVVTAKDGSRRLRTHWMTVEDC